jgi:hypothetical protein
VDLSGQICADSIGSKLYSGVGGQMDFMRGAALSHGTARPPPTTFLSGAVPCRAGAHTSCWDRAGGKPIIALPSTTSRGESKIVPRLKRGAGVVTTRAHVHWVRVKQITSSRPSLSLALCSRFLLSPPPGVVFWVGLYPPDGRRVWVRE